jgi:hypothetical protein
MTKAATKPAVAAPAKVAAPAVKPEVKAEAAEAATVAAPTATATVSDTDAIWVRTKQGVARRCRAGMVFTAVPVQLPVDDLSQDQLDAIEADPLLEAVDAPVADAANETAE